MMLKVRTARPKDVDTFVKVVRGGFDRHHLRFMIYGCKGAAEYLRNQLTLPHRFCDTVHVVGEQRDSLVGAVELKLQHDGLFLNYIATAPEQRRKGIGRELLYRSLLSSRKRHQNKITLDVFQDNKPAYQWYERLGFRRKFSNLWLSIPLADVDDDPRGTITGYGQAQVCQQSLGFSQFTLMTDKGVYNIGRLGSAWFRTTQEELLVDRDALTCLRVLDRKRKLLAIVREDVRSRFPKKASSISRSLRMAMDLNVLLNHLAGEGRKP